MRGLCSGLWALGYRLRFTGAPEEAVGGPFRGVAEEGRIGCDAVGEAEGGDVAVKLARAALHEAADHGDGLAGAELGDDIVFRRRGFRGGVGLAEIADGEGGGAVVGGDADDDVVGTMELDELIRR